MAKKQTNTITINDVEYNFDDLNDTQKVLVNHVDDLNRKLRSAQFNLDQLSVGRNTFVKMLTDSLEAPTEDAAAA